jgi:hypothetical protein
MSATVRELNRHFMDVWWDCETGDARLPDLGKQYTLLEQTQNEKSLLQFLSQVDQALSNPPRGRGGARDSQARLGVSFRLLAEESLGFTTAQLDLLPSQSF